MTAENEAVGSETAGAVRLVPRRRIVVRLRGQIHIVGLSRRKMAGRKVTHGAVMRGSGNDLHYRVKDDMFQITGTEWANWGGRQECIVVLTL